MSSTSDTNCIVAFTNFKDAALYFDYVVPIPDVVLYVAINKAISTVFRQRPREPFDGEHFLREVVEDISTTPMRLLPPHLASNDTFIKLLFRTSAVQAVGPVLSLLRTAVQGEDQKRFNEKIKELNRVTHTSVLNTKSIDIASDAVITRYGLTKYPAFMPADWIDSDEANTNTSVPVSPTMACGLCLANMRLIDTSKAEWKQIFEFREDENSRLKLNRLRRFFITSYAGKSFDHIEAELQNRLEDYEDTARRWGFETRLATLEAIINSPTLMAAAGGALISSAAGRPDVALLWAGGIEFAGVILSLSRRAYDRKKEVEQHPLAYIIEGQKAIISNIEK